MDTEIRTSPTPVPLGVDARIVPLRDLRASESLRGGDLAADAAAIHRDVRALLEPGRAGDDEVLAGLLDAEAALSRFQLHLEEHRSAHAARTTPYLVRDARRSIREACALVDDELERLASDRPDREARQR